MSFWIFLLRISYQIVIHKIIDIFLNTLKAEFQNCRVNSLNSHVKPAHNTTRNLVTRNIVNQMLYDRENGTSCLSWKHCQERHHGHIRNFPYLRHFLLLALLLPFSLSHNMLFRMNEKFTLVCHQMKRGNCLLFHPVRHKKCFPIYFFSSHTSENVCAFTLWIFKDKKIILWGGCCIQWPCMTSNWKLKIYWKY